jgi:glycosyltransferase involved in cell wall biosynthesis
MGELELSICIPTFNRSEMVLNLVEEILSSGGDFEVCVHVDGSTDDTYQKLSAVDDSRLHVSYGQNQGRAGSLCEAVKRANGRFCMLFDDDDKLSADGLARVLDDCKKCLPKNCIGRIYHLSKPNEQRLGASFPVAISNLIALRADHKVDGDKKEVILTQHLRKAMEIDEGSYRRVPTSLYWARLSLDFNIACENHVIGTKNYLDDGMSDRIRALKRKNSAPLILLHKARIQAFFRKRYRSISYALRSVFALIWYSVQSRLVR